MGVRIKWLGHASFKIESEGGFITYIDPWKIREKDSANLILITHSHYDHLSVDDVGKIQGKATKILVPKDGKEKLKGDVQGIGPGEIVSIGNVRVRTIPAYNIGKSFHPKENGWVGYILEIDNISIYHAGDTDFIPEMKDLKPYVALLPIGGTYTMGVDDALKAADAISPHLVIPMHYGDIVGSEKDAERFASKCRFEVKVLSKGEMLEVG